MTSFKVSTEDLLALASQLSSLMGELGQAGQMTPDTSAAGPDVESKLQSFFSDWSEGLGQIQKNLGHFSDALRGAGDGYDHADNSIAGGFHLA